MSNGKYPDAKIFLECLKESHSKGYKWTKDIIASIFDDRSHYLFSSLEKSKIKRFKDRTVVRVSEIDCFDAERELSFFLIIEYYVLCEITKQYEQEKGWIYLYYDIADKMPQQIINSEGMLRLIEKEKATPYEKGCNLNPMTDKEIADLIQSDLSPSLYRQTDKSKDKYFWNVRLIFIHRSKNIELGIGVKP